MSAAGGAAGMSGESGVNVNLDVVLVVDVDARAVPELRKRASKSSKFSSGEGSDGVVMREWDLLRKVARRSSRVVLCGVSISAD
jgi:hypothetical protein